MRSLTWNEAHVLKTSFQDLVNNTNHFLLKNSQCVVCLLVSPINHEAKQALLNNYLHTRDTGCERLFATGNSFHVIAVIKNKTNFTSPYYSFDLLDNILDIKDMPVKAHTYFAD